ncbi:MAG: M48 family metalloprotease, partial [Pseudomonadota bacterium]
LRRAQKAAHTPLWRSTDFLIKRGKSSMPFKPLAKKTLSLCFAGVIAATSIVSSANAQRGGIPLVRDSEIEALMRDYSAEIFKAAGFQTGFVNIHLVNSKDFNAFVADGRRMFMNLGTLQQAETPNEVIGVIAHEAGHIQGGHLARIRQAAAGARAIGIFSQLLAGAAVVAGAASGSGAAVQGGFGALQGGQSLAQRTILAHQRTEEAAADRAALILLEKTGQSAQGIISTFERLQRQIPLSGRFIDPYLLSHPLPRERVRAVREKAQQSPHFNRKDPPDLVKRHRLMQAKIAAFTEHPTTVGRRYPKKDKSLEADYARAIVGYRHGNVKRAQRAIDKLIERSPRYPYFWELKGQAYLESAQPARAIAPLRKAISLSPRAPLMKAMLGHALVATEDPKHTQEAIKVLREAVALDQSIGNAHRQLAIAYAREGRIGDAELATANGLFFFGDIKGAKTYAARAKKRLPTGSRGWLQADDIIAYRRPKL